MTEPEGIPMRWLAVIDDGADSLYIAAADWSTLVCGLTGQDNPHAMRTGTNEPLSRITPDEFRWIHTGMARIKPGEVMAYGRLRVAFDPTPEQVQDFMPKPAA